MAYCVNPQRRSFAVASLAQDEGLEGLCARCPALAVKALYGLYEKTLAETEMTAVYEEIEKPLSHVLRSMEREGVLIDAEALRTLGDSFREHIARLTGEIYGLAGEQFNINSPKQLS